MKIELTKTAAEFVKGDLLALAVFKDENLNAGELASLDKALNGDLSALLTKRPDLADAKASTLIYSFGRVPAEKILIVGLGEKEKFDKLVIRELAGSVIRTANKEKATDVTIAIANLLGQGIDTKTLAFALSESAVLMNYYFRGYSSEEDKSSQVEKLHILANGDETDVELGIATGKAYAESANIARDLGNTPANLLTPTDLAAKAKEIADKHKLEITILEEADMKKMGMGGILSVSQGSAQPAKMIAIKYLKGSKDDEVIGLVGKGLTFDSGGISIKPSNNMHLMKGDMCGAATMLSALDAIATLGIKKNIICVIGTTENMPSGTATRPGDVVKTMSGKTIEILNTDAEGRVVLADALSYAIKLGADKLIDAATLTGAMVVALGDITTGVMSNNQEFTDEFLATAADVGERAWQMPLFPEYREMIKSDLADVKNIGGRGAGSITAALFLETFVEDKPWIHLDIAGSSWSEVENNLITKGATGSMVRTIVRYVTDKA